MSGHLVSLQSVGRFYPPFTHALVNANLTLKAASTTAIVGSSGSGKSTLLSILGLLDRPSSGTYDLLGQDVSELNDSALSELRREHFGFVFQAFHLLEHLTVQENVEHALEITTPRMKGLRSVAIAAVERVGLAHRMNSRPMTLSGGEQQRVAIARAIARRPKILLCDEPTGNLDSKNAGLVLKLILNQSRSGSCVVIVTHDLKVAERCGTIVSMKDGCLSSRRNELINVS